MLIVGNLEHMKRMQKKMKITHIPHNLDKLLLSEVQFSKSF